MRDASDTRKRESGIHSLYSSFILWPPSAVKFIVPEKKMSQDCIFCKVARGEIGGTPLFRNERVTAFRDINPQAPTHLLIIPNQHLASLDTATREDQALLGELLGVA